MSIYNKILENISVRCKMLAVLIDPDNNTPKNVAEIAKLCNKAKVDIILIGGSLMTADNIESCIDALKVNCNIPVILFPGGVMQISNKADGIMLLSLISGRNPDMLIGKHVESAGVIRKSKLEVIPTAYILINGGKVTSVQYVSNTMPIPEDKNDLVVSTAIAGEMLGLKLIYLEAGSGASFPVPLSVISDVRNSVDLPLCVGGGIKTTIDARKACENGADIVVIGNAFEKNPELICEISDVIHSIS